jgi:hypothetical protein
MVEQSNAPKVGEFFSRNYLRSENMLSDDPRSRHRIVAYLKEYFVGKSAEVGRHVEKKLGIKCVEGSSYPYVDWEGFLGKLPTVDFLDVLTATMQFRPNYTTMSGRIAVKHDLVDYIRRVFSEQNLAYRIDDKGGIHPLIDAEFTSNTNSIIRNLTELSLTAALAHVQAADRAMMPQMFDGRQAIRSTFDAVENLLKVIDPKKTQLGATQARDTLGNFLVVVDRASPEEGRATTKLIEALADWVDAAHNYRHAPGGAEPSQPSEAFTVAFVSQGFSYIRWICDLYATKRSAN